MKYILKIIKKNVISAIRRDVFLRANLALIFVCSVFLWHWLGPIYGTFDLGSVLNIIWNEFGNPIAWPMTLIVVLATALHLRMFATNNIRSLKLLHGALVAMAAYFVAPLPNSLISEISLLALVFFLVYFSDLNKSIPLIALNILGFVFISYAFTILKLSVFMRGYEYDSTLVCIDKFLGFEWIRGVIISLSNSNMFILKIADISYQMIFPIIGMFSIVACMHGDKQRDRFLFSMFTIYAFGAILYIAFPAWGPFMFSDFNELAPNWFDGPWRTAEIQRFIASNSMKIKSGDYIFDSIPAYGFVAAMPSLHVATPAVAFLLSKNSGLPVFLISFILLVFSIWAAIVTGMHYGIDVVVGLALAIFSVKISNFSIR